MCSQASMNGCVLIDAQYVDCHALLCNGATLHNVVYYVTAGIQMQVHTAAVVRAQAARMTAFTKGCRLIKHQYAGTGAHRRSSLNLTQVNGTLL